MLPTAPHATDATPTGKLHRTLSLWQVALAGTGTVLGAGIYALIGPAAGRAGGALWMGFLLAGIAAGATAYVYVRFSHMSPRNSPEFQYTALAFGPHAGFVAGWLMLAADLLAAATVALGFGGYLSHLTGWPIVFGAMVLILAVAGAIFAGIAESIFAGIVLSLVEVAGLVFVATAGIPFWPEADFLEAPLGFDGVVAAASLIFFAFLGFDEIGNLTEEMRDPQRDLPRALFITMVASTSIYALVALSVVAVVDW
jgi:basic amino acid/polyamine antiporter, APA family